MLLDLKNLFTDGGRLSVDYGFCPDAGILEHCSEIQVKGELEGKSGIVYLHVDVRFALSLDCDRCAAPYTEPHDYEIQHVLVTSLNDEKSDELILVDDFSLDLDELLVTDILLELPMKHLCREDCKGLCPKCGKNLNEGPCSCSTKAVDPRWAALLDSFEQ